MILDNIDLNRRLSVDDQKNKIAQIRNSKPNDILFITNAGANTDIQETLLYMSGVKHAERMTEYCTVWYRTL